jgi:hypothetical protein
MKRRNTRKADGLSMVAAAALGLQPCLAFSASYSMRQPTFHHRRQRRSFTDVPIRSTALCLQKHTDEDPVLIPDGNLLLTDIVAVALACQLLGLQDVLDDPTFWDNGGWFQAPTTITTLPTLVSRISVNSIGWIASGVLQKGYNVERCDTFPANKVAKIVAGFLLLRLALAFTTIALQYGEWDMIGILRECYFVLTAAIGARYVVYRLFYR